MYIEETDPVHLAAAIGEFSNGAAALICVAEDTEIDINLLIKELNAKEISFAGGIFPRVIYRQQVFTKGVVVSTHDSLVEEGVFMIQNIHSKDFEIPYKKLDDNSNYCVVTFVDGLTSNISFYLSELYRQFGNKTIYIGGGAGSISLNQRPCVFNCEGIFENAAVFMLLKGEVSTGVKHGWVKIAGPVIATKTNRNIINQLNWQNAFDVYKDALGQNRHLTIEKENFFNISKAFPFGILKDGMEYVVRDPIGVDEDGGLICVGEVPENTMLDILEGKNGMLIAAAKEAALACVKSAKHSKKAFIIDCISRVLFLEEDFQKELNDVAQVLNTCEPDSISGALTLGEIASEGNGYLEFYNKTIVVGLFE